MADTTGGDEGRDVHDDDADAPRLGPAGLPLSAFDMSEDGCDLDGIRVPEVAEELAADRRLHSDPHDFAGLYVRHRAAFTLHARRYLRDARDADEVVQEAFLRLFLALPELETELQALAYCRRTITNLCIDRYRTQARRPHIVHLESVPLEELPDEDTGDPVVRAEDAALVREALSMLSPLHRAALVKREVEEKPLPVIADELEIAEENVKHLLFRARRALRRLLSGTSLAPGHDGEGGLGLGATARAGSGGLAGLLLALVLGIGSGPNLEAIPVVGVDLPDVIGVASLAKTVGTAVTDAVDAVAAVGGSEPGGAGRGSDGADPVPLPAASASPSPSAAATPVPTATATSPVAPAPAPVPATETDATPSPTPSVASPSAEPATEGDDGATEPSASPEPTGSPRPSGSPSPSPSASASPSASPSGSPAPDPSAAGSPTPRASPQTPPVQPAATGTATAPTVPTTADRLPARRGIDRTKGLSRRAEVPGPWR